MPVITNGLRPGLGTSGVTEFVGVVTSGVNTIAGITIEGSGTGSFSGIDINDSLNISISNTNIFDVTFGILGVDGKFAANIDINNVLIEGIVQDLSIDPTDAQFDSGGISLAWDDPIVASSINICNSKIVGAPAYPILINGDLIDSQVNFSSNQLFGGHRGIELEEISAEAISRSAETRSLASYQIPSYPSRKLGSMSTAQSAPLLCSSTKTHSPR